MFLKKIIIPLSLLSLSGFAGCSGEPFATDQNAASEEKSWPAPTNTPIASPGSSDYPTLSGKLFAQSRSQLFVVDPETLELSLVGEFHPQIPPINDIAVTPSDELYALSSNGLYRVNAQTAEAKLVTKVEGNDNVALTFEVHGTLLASDKAGALRRIDPQTGSVTEIGKYGENLGSSGDLVAIKDGTLFGVNDVGEKALADNELMTIDPQTGQAKVVGPIGYSLVWGLAYWRGKVYGLAKSGEFLSIDPLTGKGTLIKKFDYEFWGAAVTPLAPTTEEIK